MLLVHGVDYPYSHDFQSVYGNFVRLLDDKGAV